MALSNPKRLKHEISKLVNSLCRDNQITKKDCGTSTNIKTVLYKK